MLEFKRSDLEEIRGLNHGEYYIIPESDYGRAEVWNINDMLFLFEIPMFGGIPIFKRAFPMLLAEELIKLTNSWT